MIGFASIYHPNETPAMETNGGDEARVVPAARLAGWLRRIEPLELRVAVQQRQVGVAPRPVRVAEAGCHALGQRVQRFGFPFSLQKVHAAL